MTYSTVAFTAFGPFSWTPPSTLLGATINFDLAGAAGGDSAAGIAGGPGGTVSGGVAASAGGTFTGTVGAQEFGGAPGGGNPGASGGIYGAAGYGGGATALWNPSGTLVAMAGGGGGAGGGGASGLSGIGGAGGPVAGAGVDGAGDYPGVGGNGASGSTAGAGGDGYPDTDADAGANGAIAGEGGGGDGGQGDQDNATGGGGGGGGGGYAGGGGGGGAASGSGGGGGGGSSYAIPGAASVVYNASAWPNSVGVAYIGYRVADPPPAPSLATVGPADAADTITIPWVYNNATDSLGDSSGPQTAYALRIKLTSATTYSYYDAATGTLVDSIVWNDYDVADEAGAQAVLPANLLTNGDQYQYSVATQGTNSSLQSVFPNDVLLEPIAEEPVTVSVENPAPTATPTIHWSAATQSAYRVVLYTLAQTTGAGFVAGLSPSTWDSGTISSSSVTGATVPSDVDLTNGATYLAYVQLTDSSDNPSQWGYEEFVIEFDEPVSPTVNVQTGTDPDTGMPINTVLVQTNDNQLSAVDSSLETGVGTWVDKSGCTVAQSDAEALDGAFSLLMTSSSTSAMAAVTGTETYPVLPGQSYRALASFRAAATARSCSVGLAWYTSGGSLISTTTGTAVDDTTTGWTQCTVSGTAPSTAAYVAVVATVGSAATSEKHYVDCVGLWNGTGSPWSLGGFVGNSTITVQCSTDGETWQTLGTSGAALGATSQSASAIDYWSPNGVPIYYRVQVASTAYGQQVVSAWVQVEAAPMPNAGWWFVDPTEPVSDDLGLGAVTVHRYYDIMAISASQANVSYTLDPVEDQGVFAPVDSPYNVVVRGQMRANGPEQVSLGWFDDTDYLAFEALRARQRTLLVKSDIPADGTWYLALGSDAPYNTLRDSQRTVAPKRELTITCSVVAPVPWSIDGGSS